MVVIATVQISETCDAISSPFFRAMNRPNDTTNDAAIAATSLHALTRHQNQRSRYNRPVPAPIESSSSKLSRAVSSTYVSEAAITISIAVTSRPMRTYCRSSNPGARNRRYRSFTRYEVPQLRCVAIVDT